MKSAYTLMKLHERAGVVLYMLARSERIAAERNKETIALETNDTLIWYKNRPMIEHTEAEANKYQSIAIYLRTRYASIIDKITQ